jgi:hypothetical protein
MLTPYTRLIRFIMDGEPVNAAVANRPSQDLASRTQNLKEILDALAAAQMIEIPDAILQAGVTVGTPVYLDGATNTYRPARSATSSQENGNPALAESFFAGIVVSTEAGTHGVIGVTGRFIGLTLAQWAAHIETRDLVGGIAVPGHYYLSSTQAGRLTLTPSGLGVYVGQLSASGAMDVRAGNPDYASHTHHEFVLWPLPAADLTDPLSVVETLGVWSIPGHNTAYRGWLPATTQPAVNVPPGVTAASSFWYNLDHPTDAALRALFPPVPVDSFVVVRGTEIQPIGRIVVNEFGIWWTQNKNDATNAAPWSENVKVDPAHEENIQFWFSRIMLATDGGIVRSLSVSSTSELDAAFLDLGGNPATDGTLQLAIKSLKEATAPDPVVQASALAVKGITGKQFTRGPVISRVKGTPGIVVTGSQGNAADGWYGDLLFALSNTILTQGNADIADLNNAKIESISGLQGVTLVAQRTAAPAWTLFIPPGLVNVTVKIKFWVYVSAEGTLSTATPIQLNYKVVPPVTTPTAIPAWASLAAFTDASMGIGGAGRSGKYEVTDAISIPGVPGGSTVVINLTRSANDDYGGNLTVLRVEYELV